jgi:AcrR family transcriptional regulator
VSTDRSTTNAAARVIDELTTMLGEMDVHDVRVQDLARRAGVAIPTVYYNFQSLDEIVAEATIALLDQFLVPIHEAVGEMELAVADGDLDRFRVAATSYVDEGWTESANQKIHRLAPLIAYFRQIAPGDTRLRRVQAREVQALIDVLVAAQGRGWIHPDDDAPAFVIVHWTCMLGQAVFYHPAFGALTAVDFSHQPARLRYQTSLRSDLRHMSVIRHDAD